VLRAGPGPARSDLAWLKLGAIQVVMRSATIVVSSFGWNPSR
jgi:hypothetical protein